MHIVISGYYGFDNVGDEAILFSIITALKRKQPDIKVTVLSNNPEATKNLYKVDAVNRHRINDIIHVIKVSDGLISGGGSLLQDATGIKSIPYYTGIIQLARVYKKPVFIYAQGIGPINRTFCKRLVAMTLNKVNRITVRDWGSKQFLQQIGVKQETTIAPDPVLGLDSSSFEYNGMLPDNPFIAVSVRSWSTDTYYKRKIASCLDKLASDGYSILFVPMHGAHDEIASKETAAEMKASSQIISGQLSMQGKIAIIGKSKLLIGMRLHALIFSAITYTPFIAISYDPKIDAFASIFDQGVVGHVAKDDWDGTTLYEHTRKKLENRMQVTDILKDRVKGFQEDAVNTAELALETFAADHE